LTSIDRKNKKFARVKLFLSDIKPLLLSHHPDCETFSNHVYHIGKYKLCIGCFTFYPMVLITFIVVSLFLDLNYINLIILAYLSFLFISPIVLNILGLTRYKFLKIFSKVATGIGAGLLIVFIIYFPYFNLIFRILFLLNINFLIGAIAYIRTNQIKKDCLKCEYKGDWQKCPGLGAITEKLYEHGFKKKRD